MVDPMITGGRHCAKDSHRVVASSAGIGLIDS